MYGKHHEDEAKGITTVCETQKDEKNIHGKQNDWRWYWETIEDEERALVGGRGHKAVNMSPFQRACQRAFSNGMPGIDFPR